MSQNRALSMLGMAQKAGKVASGEFSVEKSIKTGKAHLVLAASDASDNTRKKFQNMCDFYDVPFAAAGSREEIGKAIGKEFRVLVSVLDENLAKEVMKRMESERTTE